MLGVDWHRLLVRCSILGSESAPILPEKLHQTSSGFGSRQYELCCCHQAFTFSLVVNISRADLIFICSSKNSEKIHSFCRRKSFLAATKPSHLAPSIRLIITTQNRQILIHRSMPKSFIRTSTLAVTIRQITHSGGTDARTLPQSPTKRFNQYPDERHL